MSGLLLPPRVQREIEQEKHAAERERRKQLAHRLLDFDDPICLEWQPVVAKIDPYLKLGRARPMAYEHGLNVRPNFYHWVRDNPTAPMTIEPITGPDDEFREPDSRFFDELMANDLQDPRVWRALIERAAAREEEAERQKQADRVERQADIMEHWNAVSRTQVSMNTDTPWTQNNSAAARRDRRARKP